MEIDLEIPARVPAMTLSGVVLFPQVMLPLRIFEARYRTMLEDVLASHRLFAIATLDEQEAERNPETDEPPLPVATVGMVRASHRNPDGTSNLVLQGLIRARIRQVARDEPYRLLDIEPLGTRRDLPVGDLVRLQQDVLARIDERRELGEEIPDPALAFLRSLRDPEIFADLAAYTLVESSAVKQALLAELSLGARYRLLLDHLATANEILRLRRRLQRGLDDERIGWN